MQPVTTQYIESVPGKCGGKPCIAGTRIRVWDIYVASEIRGETPDQIIAQYPSLTLAQVHAALAYYWDNREAIEQQMKQADQFVEEMAIRRRDTRATGPGPLASKLAGLEPGDDSLSP